MSNAVSDRLQQQAERIMRLWEERARQEVEAAIHQNSLLLRALLPLYLNQLANELSTKIERTPARIRADEKESTRIGKQHGYERASYVNYSMPQLIFEYHILRQIIFQVLEEEVPLKMHERDIIIDSIEQAVNDAATQFSQTLREIQTLFTETLTHDLRNPITIVKTGMSLLLGRLGQGNLRITTRIAWSVSHLFRSCFQSSGRLSRFHPLT